MIYFVAGTDTDSGKTIVSSALLHLAQEQGIQTLGVKPIASGCQDTPAGLRNSDALSLMAKSSIKLEYDEVNPFSFEPAIAPHIAAKEQGVPLSPEALQQTIDLCLYQDAELCIIEGAGGWRLPLGSGAFLSDVVKAWQLPVILVVGVKLGCLNHAVLTQEAILADGLKIAGWVANQVDSNMSCYQENIESLNELMQGPCLGEIPYLASATAEVAANYLSLSFMKS
ncbi:ATP-dependent dethiobiotin synthetase BioD [Shewanella gelidii]|uniref:ATP-dependent dethiobiotin synthetase BioD n=1 Tax=Shewanella gelidii TaxID=1642821 RepID=A0A917JU65_9GAMM|nr:dethiobiotin synthase [Shewanella gelidii]GGI84452.1 ATP-dependent dethiobiotin synthetase BioD [Shewanella gelidii]